MNKKPNIKKLIMAGLFAALTCIFTMLPIGIPSLTQGYIHFGDCFVLLAGWYLGAVYGPFAAGIGSALTDILGGYLIYAPATLIIKAAVALIAAVFARASCKKGAKIPLRLVGGIVAELVMVMGYFIYSATVMGYGWAGSAVEIPNNLVQGGVGIIAATVIAQIMDSTGVLKNLK